MDNLALYRKYRPLTFSEVVGQNSVTSSLSAQVASGRVSHAYLFTGTRGTGKTSCAKILARAICCQKPVNGDPCNKCSSCKSVLNGSALDITEIDAASNNGVDNIREIRQEAIYAPSELSYRVYIVDEVHMLSAGAFNALLKILEEPPAHVVFILATTEVHKVPATILSRCQRYDFRRIPTEIMASALLEIAKKESFSLTEDAANMIAAMGDGSMRDSISLLDRVGGTTHDINAESVTDILGLASDAEILDIFTYVLANDAPSAIASFTNAYMAGRDIIAIFDNLLSLLRDIYLYKAVKSTDFLLSRWRLKVPELAGTCAVNALENCIESINFFLSRTSRTSVRRLDAEMCLIKMALPDFGNEQPVKIREPKAKEIKPSDDTPPWDVDEKEVAKPEAHKAPETSEKAPVRVDYTPPASGGNVSSARYESLRSGIEGRVSSSAVKVYLGRAVIDETGDDLYIGVPEEALIFINKPEILAILDEVGKSVGYNSVKVGKQKPQVAENPIERIKSAAESLGVNIKIKP